MKSTHKEFLVGQATIGVTAVRIPATRLANTNQRGILIKAYGDNDTAANTVPVFVGNAQVTVDNGFPISPGEAVPIPVTGEDDIYAIASAASQKIAWMTV